MTQEWILSTTGSGCTQSTLSLSQLTLKRAKEKAMMIVMKMATTPRMATKATVKVSQLRKMTTTETGAPTPMEITTTATVSDRQYGRLASASELKQAKTLTVCKTIIKIMTKCR